MYCKVNSDTTTQLINLPESGIGYQFIEAQQDGKDSLDLYMVLNAELVIPIQYVFNSLQHENYYYLLTLAKEIHWSRFRVLSIKEIREIYSIKPLKKNHQMKKEFLSNEVIRILPFKHDNRMVNKQLTKGSLCVPKTEVTRDIEKGKCVLAKYGIPNFDNEKLVYHYQCHKKDGAYKAFPLTFSNILPIQQQYFLQTNSKNTTKLDAKNTFFQLVIS